MKHEEIVHFIQEKFKNLYDNELEMLSRRAYEYCEESDDEYPCDDWYWEDILDNLGAAWWRCGASKLVVAFTELPNYVIKIPFQGESVFKYESGEEIEFRLFDGAHSRLGYTSAFESWDYCGAEAWVYGQAEEHGLEAFFCGTFYACEIEGTLFYYSERMEEEYCYDLNPSDDSKHKAQDMSSYCFCKDEVARFIDDYGIDAVINFIDFMNTLDINDMHGGNIGFVDNKLVCVDYSGWGH